MNNGMRFHPLFPDVLGAVTGGPRIYMDKLQCAIGIFPEQTFINQPFEVVIVLQNMIDQSLQVKIGIQLPKADKRGNPVIMDISKKTVSLGLAPGEVGVLRVPVIAHPPTQPGKGYPIRVAVRYRAANTGTPVRPPGGGGPPSVLAISPFKLQVLREIKFSGHTWNESAEIITGYVDITPKQIPLSAQNLTPRYETLWAQEQMAKEIELVRARLPEAEKRTRSAAYGSSYPAFLETVPEHFAEAGMPLHPGEIKAIAKIMAYTIDDAPEFETYIRVEETRWFQTLCQVLAHDEALLNMDRNDLFAHYVFDAVLYEAVLLGFRIIESRGVKEDLGDRAERVNYANRLLGWMSGQGKPDLNYVYLPLVQAGVAVNRLVKHGLLESPWEMLIELREAMQGRKRLISGETIVVFEILDFLLTDAEKMLEYQRVPRP